MLQSEYTQKWMHQVNGNQVNVTKWMDLSDRNRVNAPKCNALKWMHPGQTHWWMYPSDCTQENESKLMPTSEWCHRVYKQLKSTKKMQPSECTLANESR